MHLRLSIWFYLLFLPFQVYPSLKWITVPGTAFASFLFLGFLEIGAEVCNCLVQVFSWLTDFYVP